MDADEERRNLIADAVRRLDDAGLNQGSTGNVSLRQGAGMLVTPTGARASTLTAGAIVEMDLDGRVIAGAGIPSSEWRLHAELLRHNPWAGAVVHSHADCCTALSALRRPIPAFHYMVAGFGGDMVPCARYEPFGSDALAAAAVEACRGYRACLLANHGMVAMGSDLGQALDLTVRLERLARQYLLALGAGEPVILTRQEMDEVRRRYAHYGKAWMPR